MNNKTVLIVGIGNIGTKLYNEYLVLSPDRYDPWKGYNEKKPIHYDFAFITVDTPIGEDPVGRPNTNGLSSLWALIFSAI